MSSGAVRQFFRWLIPACVLGAIAAAPASASHTQEAIFQDGGRLLADPVGTLAKLRVLGVDRVRLFMHWNDIAPQAMSHRRPRGFYAAGPAAYPKANWASWDGVIRQAKADGIGVDLDVGGGAPLWATPPGAPTDKPHPNWQPKAAEFGAFMHAVGERYSGNYNPSKRALSPGDPGDLPAVDFWSIWNEPDYGPSLAPQGAPGNVGIERSPWSYRRLVDAAWSALHQTGHAEDTILFGEVAPRGYPTAQFPRLSFGIFSGMKPLVFLRALYCVDSAYRPLHGAPAALRGCPTTAAGSRSFRARNPALFGASGFADHPYSRWYPPNAEPQNDPDYSSLADIGLLERALDRLNRVYGSNTRFPIWNTEYGYITSPPKHFTARLPYISPGTAAYYLNWAEYISWRDPRIRSTAQYLLGDPEPATSSTAFGGFASGLLKFDGTPKPTYDAYRLPLYLPVRTTRRGLSLEVWGCARPAPLLSGATGAAQTVSIQLRAGATSRFKTVQTVPITSVRGYFDTRVVFPSGGTVRLMWSYSPVDAFSPPVPVPVPVPVYSRLVQITL
jgi:hypothetical protein